MITGTITHSLYMSKHFHFKSYTNNNLNEQKRGKISSYKPALFTPKTEREKKRENESEIDIIEKKERKKAKWIFSPNAS